MSEPAPIVLVVDDEIQIRRFLRTGFELNGFVVHEAGTGTDAIRTTTLRPVDLVIVDLGLPDMDGSEVVERIRSWSSVPIIVLSVRSTEAEKVHLLELGADDYVVKPFGMAELLARAHAAMRRYVRVSTGEPVIRIGPLSIDLAARIVTIDGETARDFDDAVYVERREDGGWLLQVHIADVAHYVTPESPLDREARLRGNSVYFIDRAVPMLPESLSNGMCSLNPREERLVLSAIMNFDAAGHMLTAVMVPGVIRSAERMTYTNVNKVLTGDPEMSERRGICDAHYGSTRAWDLASAPHLCIQVIQRCGA